MFFLNKRSAYGIFLMNLDFMRAHHIQDAFSETMKMKTHLIRYGDQCVINMTLHNQMLELPRKYNSAKKRQKDDVIICSPQTYKIDANVKSMIDSCIIFAEGDNYIYSHICPVCGLYVDGEQDDGNCYCANCDSAYSLMSHGRNNKVKESVWIKRLKNPESI